MFVSALNFLKPRVWVSIAIAIILAAAIVGLVVRKPLLVAYHRNAMAEIWQTELGISPRKGLAASIRSLVGVAPGPSNPGAAGRALLHRDALLRLGFFTNRTFSMAPVSVAHRITSSCATEWQDNQGSYRLQDLCMIGPIRRATSLV